MNKLIPIFALCFFISYTTAQLDYIPLGDSSGSQNSAGNNSASNTPANGQDQNNSLTNPSQTTPPAPSQLELAEIDLSSWFTVEEVHVGDTLSYVIKAEWVNPKIPISVLAPESLSFEGLSKVRVSSSSKKLAQNSSSGPQIKNQSFFIYHLKAALPGSGKALSARLPYFNAVSKDKEYLAIAPQIVNVLPAKKPLFSRGWCKILFGLLLLGGAGFLGYQLWQMSQSKKKEKTAPAASQKEKLKELKSRLSVGDSKSLLLQMEEIAMDYFKEENKLYGNRFEDLLIAYLKRSGNENAESWNKLKSQFELARFGGGQLASHELMDSYKTLCLCIHHQEDEHD